MVAYSYKRRFIPPLESGDKTQTIRTVSKRRHARVGDKLQHYFGMRTKACRKIIPDTTCTSVDEVIVELAKGEIVDVHINGQSVVDLDQFARADGFESIDDMAHYWADNHASGQYTGRSVPLIRICW